MQYSSLEGLSTEGKYAAPQSDDHQVQCSNKSQIKRNRTMSFLKKNPWILGVVFIIGAFVLLVFWFGRVSNIEVKVVPPGQSLDRLTGRDFLLTANSETSNYGLYSYLLLAKKPTPENKELYIAVLKAYLNIETVREFEDLGIKPKELNITYLPVKRLPPNHKLEAEFFLKNYDYARAKIILRKLRIKGTGPFILSYQSPLSTASQVDPGKLLKQDLTGIPPRLAYLWVNNFIDEAAKVKYWDTNALQNFMVSFRTKFAILADGFTEVKTASAEAIDFLKDKIKLKD